MLTDQDSRYMQRALALAASAVAQASPNPQVGCVLVRDGVTIGEGTHLYAARDHAEIAALKQADFDAVGATAYVTLEPCSHHGRTPPCADALIAAKIARCVVATLDPNPQVSGQGVAKLRAAGIEVEVGLLQAEARAMNDAFALSTSESRPWVTLKAGLSVDGRLAPPAFQRIPNQPFWLTSAASRAEVQRLRHGSDAILTGIGTVLADDPSLTDRTGRPRRRPLMRVILDSQLRIPLDGTLLRTLQHADPDLWIFYGEGAPVSEAKRMALAALGVRLTAVPMNPRLDLAEILRHLHQAGMLSVLLEAGPALNGAFLKQHLVDRAVLFYAETELGPEALPFAEGFASPFALEEQMSHIEKVSFGADVCVTGLLHDPWASLADLS